MQTGVALLLSTLLAAVAVGFVAIWIIALVDLLQRADYEFPSRGSASTERWLWAAVVVLFGGLGAIAYYVMVMRPYPRGR
jgi:H+/Cl- antiporter ClcA